MQITKLGHNDAYTVKTTEHCHTFFNEVVEHEHCVELRTNSYVSGAFYDTKKDEFLAAWGELQCK